MAKLNQIIAVTQGKKTHASTILTQAHHGWKPEVLNGISRIYTPLDAENGDQLPPENKKVQLKVKDVIASVCGELTEFMDCVATQETGNTVAKADIVVDDKVVASQVPVSVLLFLEKQVTDLITFIKNLPTLPTDREWSWSDDANCFVTEPVKQLRSAKLPKTHVKFEPTQYQPGQAEIIYVDTPVGTWSSKYFSGAISAKDQDEFMGRARKLQEAIKVAREKANSTDVEQVKIGKNILSYVFEVY